MESTASQLFWSQTVLTVKMLLKKNTRPAVANISQKLLAFRTPRELTYHCFQPTATLLMQGLQPPDTDLYILLERATFLDNIIKAKDVLE